MKSCERTAIADVKNTIIGKLSKGYRQRVGLAQAIIHNPPVLILDEPTSGLDPEQQREARQLIASLSGDHTIILSTHILSEVEQSCSKVIIINNGEIVASDSVANLHNRRRATESVRIEVAGAPASQVKQRLEQVPGVASVESRDSRDGIGVVRGPQPGKLRPCVRNWRAPIVQSGWNLTELRPGGRIARRNLPRTDEVGNSRPKDKGRRGRSPMRNVFTICGKELKSYFTSPDRLPPDGPFRPDLRILFLQRDRFLRERGPAPATGRAVSSP